MKVGRPKEFDEEQVLSIAMDYFWDQGYDNASLSQLLQQMGISKSSFYQTFGSKQALFERCLDLYVKQRIGWLEDQLQHKSAKHILTDILNTSIMEVKQYGEIRGCLVMNSAEICYKKYPDLSQLINHQFVKFHQFIKKLIESGQKQGEISSRQSASMLSSIYLNTLNGLSVLIKAGADDQMIEQVLQGLELHMQ